MKFSKKHRNNVQNVICNNPRKNIAKLLYDFCPLKTIADNCFHPNGRHHRKDRTIHTVQDVASWLN
jgi:hypothetical protein